MKALKKHNNMIFCMSKCSGSRHELKNIKNIRAKASKKHDYSSSDSFTDDSDSSLYIDREWDERINPTECKDMNKLDNVVTNNIYNKDQCSDAIKYEPKFDGKFCLSSGSKDPLPLVTVSLQGDKKIGQL